MPLARIQHSDGAGAGLRFATVQQSRRARRTTAFARMMREPSGSRLSRTPHCCLRTASACWFGRRRSCRLDQADDGYRVNAMARPFVTALLQSHKRDRRASANGTTVCATGDHIAGLDGSLASCSHGPPYRGIKTPSPGLLLDRPGVPASPSDCRTSRGEPMVPSARPSPM